MLFLSNEAFTTAIQQVIDTCPVVIFGTHFKEKYKAVVERLNIQGKIVDPIHSTVEKGQKVLVLGSKLDLISESAQSYITAIERTGVEINFIVGNHTFPTGGCATVVRNLIPRTISIKRHTPVITALGC